MLKTIVQNPNFELNLNNTPLWERSGIVITDLLGANKDDIANSVAIDSQGRIVVAAAGALHDTTFGDKDANGQQTSQNFY